MEALAAVGLAGNICQFVDFASKVLHEGKQISVSGSSLSVQHLSLVTDDLQKLLLSLDNQIGLCQKPNGALNEEDHVCVLNPLSIEDPKENEINSPSWISRTAVGK
jgi:hypothetical protein